MSKVPDTELAPFAKLLGMSTSDVRELLKKGIVQVKDGKLDTAQSLLSVTRHLLATRDTAEAKARAAAADAELKELKLATEKKKAEGKEKKEEEKTDKKKGRRKVYSETKADFICRERAKGRLIKDICEDAGISQSTLHNWKEENKIFLQAFTRAQDSALQCYKNQLEEYAFIDDSFCKDENLDPELRMRAGERAFNKIKYIIEVNKQAQQEEQNAQQPVSVPEEQMQLWALQIEAARMRIEQQKEGKQS